MTQLFNKLSNINFMNDIRFILTKSHRTYIMLISLKSLYPFVKMSRIEYWKVLMKEANDMMLLDFNMYMKNEYGNHTPTKNIKSSTTNNNDITQQNVNIVEHPTNEVLNPYDQFMFVQFEKFVEEKETVYCLIVFNKFISKWNASFKDKDMDKIYEVPQ